MRLRPSFLLWTACALVAGCGGATQAAESPNHGKTTAPATGAGSTVTTRAKPPPPTYPPYPVLLPSAGGPIGSRFTPVVRWQGHTAVSMAKLRSGIALLSFDQRFVRLALHSGTVDAGGSGWLYGPAIAGRERARLVAAFNGGFKFSVSAGGFMSDGRTGAPLRAGLGSIVTYTDGHTDIGVWNAGVPQSRRAIESVRQNLVLLINNRQIASTVGCLVCWGATIGGAADVARSALGITADGRLIWAGGEGLSVATLADALVSAGVVRAVELDINPDWVAGYLYRHRRGGRPLGIFPVVPNQIGVYGFFLVPYSRDFFSVLTR